LRTYGQDEEPTELQSALRGVRRYVDPAHPNWLEEVPAGQKLASLPGVLDKVFIVGSPETLPAMKPLCAQAGFMVKGNTLTYRGTSIDLRSEGALAVVGTAGGRQCVIGLGKCLVRPNYGRSRLVLFDSFGRFLRGQTEPKTAGFLTYKL
jgi:hypothetical protein